MESIITPLHKKHYRCISISIINSHLQHLCWSLISPCQHGFVKRRSTTTNLLELSSIVINGFKKIMQTDFVNHSLLLFKFNQLGFPCNLLTWISSYLNGRTQRVIFKIAASKLIYVTNGVPHGSPLGPLLMYQCMLMMLRFLYHIMI